MATLRPYQTELVARVKQAWQHGYKAPCIVLPCGGGKSCIVAEMAKRTTLNGNRVLFLVHRKELVEQIYATFVKWGVDMRLCDVCMIQTATRHLKALKKPALIITDENHHSIANSYKNIYKHFSDVLRVGVTATPIRLNGDGLGEVNDILITGVSAKWLIANNCLSPYEYFAPSVADLTGLKVRNGDYVTSEIETRMINNTVFGDVIKHYKNLANGKKAICYCASVKHSKAMVEQFENARISAKHIDGETPKPLRNKIIQDFRDNKIKILCNVDLISEGFDVPDCECSILLRPTKSLTLYIQQSMRCMRYKQGKKAVIIDHVGNYAHFGLPDDDREWMLDKKAKKQKEQEQSESVTQCPQCYFTFQMPENRTCPHCGYVFEKAERKQLENNENIGLKKIEGFKIDLRTPADCQSYNELLDYAKTHGYKNGWAYYQAKERGFLVDRA